MADSDDESSLHDAAYRNDVKRLRRLLSQGADPNLPDPREGERGKTPLHHLCLANSHDEEDKERSVICFELLRAAGADVNARDGYTPLEAAVAFSGNVKVFPILLRAGATLPDPSFLQELAEPRTRSYLHRVIDEGGFANLARLHLSKLTETFAPKFAGRLPPEIVRHVVSFWLHAGYYDEGGERVDEAKYDSLIADITRKVDEMASLKVVPRASRRARKLRHALEADLDSDDDWTPCS